ncbi:Putative AMP-dependent synthetase/ligase domain, AMP-binding, AMP-binding enzyme domain, ANL [Colletotrichum destructivum]|uniref:Very long-chain fatty acid transport protein n=1 Tax=Colletotrichum destructivum TaxID=34406 RepID=A0AAX4IX65_9PEZI|nr:Putative AMP-dependent synthetase/ligase domain, AMP-binding, AMP-binding enzyme domain, ANL [Colletotrichum destructivum]
MPVPLALAVPAAVAAYSYVNARISLWYDRQLLTCALPATLSALWRERTDQLNQFYVLERAALNKSSAKRTFIVFEGKKYTYRETYDQVLKYGTWLRERFGVKPKDIVAMDFQNSDVFVFLWFGLWSIGAKPAFINYNLTGKPLAHCAKAAKTKLMLIDPNVVANVGDDVRTELDDVQFVVLDDAVHREIDATHPKRAPDTDRSESQYQNLAILIYTSGTTGMPKPAIVSWAKCIVGAVFTSRFTSNSPSEVFYTAMPLYHSSAALLGFLNSLEAGATICIGRKFSTKLFWEEVRSSGATIIQYVGETCRYLLAAPPQVDPSTGENLDAKHKVRVAFGNGLRPDVWNKFKDRFGIDSIAEFYAATEGSFGTWNLSRNDFAKGAVGRNGMLYSLVLGLDVALAQMDENNEAPLRDKKTGLCKPAKSGDPGELMFRLSPNDLDRRFQGYYGNPDATKAKIMRNVFSKGDAWFRTGDVVRWDCEGRLYFSDRIGDTFRWKSENVSTQEVGEAVGSHPSVQEANVYGVEVPSHDGRAGCAAVVLHDQPSEDVMKSIAQHVKNSLPKYALPIFLRVMPPEAMQTTGTNKQQKHVLRAQGVNPASTSVGVVYWLKNDTYVPFLQRDWDELNGGRMKL